MPLNGWQDLEGDPAGARIVEILRGVRGAFERSVPAAPHVGRQADPRDDLLEVLSADAVSRVYAVRHAYGSQLGMNLAWLGGEDAGGYWDDVRTATRGVLAQLGFAWDPRLARVAFGTPTFRLRGPLVRVGGTSETDPLPPGENYIRLLREGSPTAIRTENSDLVPRPGTGPAPLLYLLLRASALLELAAASARMQAAAGVLGTGERREQELVGLGPNQSPTVWEQLDRTLPAVTGGQTIAAWLTANVPPESPELQEFRDALAALEQRPTAELERQLRETLDLGAHRLDAWITSFATRRLETMRAARDHGIHLGAYGWVEDLAPGPARTPAPAPPAGEAAGRPLMVDPSNGGYVHAPSLAHAATAAVLRSGHLAHGPDGTGERFAIDLSSRRVRSALWLLDGVRQGQPLGALLGYRFERGLAEHAGALSLERFVRPFRRFAPLVAGKRQPVAGPVEAVEADNVVDGLVLLRRWQADHDDLAWGTDGRPPDGSPERTAVEEVLAALADDVDAVADAVTAEGVHQAVLGNALRAGASVDAIARGDAPPPELEVLRTPRTGVQVDHRLALLFGATTPAAPGWPLGADQVRAHAEPRLNAWAASILHRATAVRCQTEVCSAVGSVIAARTVRLSELTRSALDVLSLAGAGDERARGELQQRIVAVALAAAGAAAGPDATVRVRFERDAGFAADEFTFPEQLELARAAREVIAGAARPLDGRDFGPPEQPASITPDVAEITARADRVATTLTALVGELTTALTGTPDADTLDGLLVRAAAFGVAGALPAGDATMDSRVAQADAVAVELGRRLEGVAAAGAEAAAATTGSGQAEAHRTRIQAARGRDFQVVVRFTLDDPKPLASTLAATRTLTGGDATAIATWLIRAARVRPGAAALQRAATYAAALQVPASPSKAVRLRVAQFPWIAGERWIALPGEVPGGRAGLAAWQVGAVKATGPLAGLLVDAWSEVVLSGSETTGVAFHFDGPDATPPHAILLAVPPARQGAWDFDALAATVDEALALAKLRAVDLDALSELGHLLPALMVAFNAAGEAISTDLSRAARP
jgi:hypothetical protein